MRVVVLLLSFSHSFILLFFPSLILLLTTMALSESLIFYLLIGVGVAAAVWLSDPGPAFHRLFPTATAVLFWPVFVPVLLSRQPDDRDLPVPRKEQPADSLATMIAHVEAELDAALASLDGWAEEALSRESTRISELKAAWSMQAARIRQMDQLLLQSTIAAGEMTSIDWPSRSEQAQSGEPRAAGRHSPAGLSRAYLHLGRRP